MKNTIYRLEWVQGGDEFVEEHASRARAQERFEELESREDVVEIEFVKVGPNGREGVDCWPDDAARELSGAIDRAFEGLRGRGKRQPIDPTPAYEAAHSTAHDLMLRLVERLHDLPAPDSGAVTWEHVKVVNEVNTALFAVIEIVQRSIFGPYDDEE